MKFREFLSEGWGAAAQERASEKLKADREEWAEKIKKENPDALELYWAWTMTNVYGKEAYQKAMAGEGKDKPWMKSYLEAARKHYIQK